MRPMTPVCLSGLHGGPGGVASVDFGASSSNGTFVDLPLARAYTAMRIAAYAAFTGHIGGVNVRRLA
jgi:hypothetical protein